MESLWELIWLSVSPNLTYFFRHIFIYNSRVKRHWIEVVKTWVTCREVIRDIIWVRPKHGENQVVIAESGSVKQDFRAFGKLIHGLFEQDGPTDQESGRGWSINRGQTGTDLPLSFLTDLHLPQHSYSWYLISGQAISSSSTSLVSLATLGHVWPLFCLFFWLFVYHFCVLWWLYLLPIPPPKCFTFSWELLLVCLRKYFTRNTLLLCFL